MLSIIIPSYKEPYLVNTLNDILNNAQGEIEILVNVDDGNEVVFPKDSRINFNYPKSPLGMRGGINEGLKRAQGDYIMKSDAHCAFAPGFDKEITQNMEDNWLVIPRRYGLYVDGWKKEMRFPAKDYHYLSFPKNSPFGLAMFPIEWKQRRIERIDYKIDDTMTMQGSCYIANRKYFMQRVGFLDTRPETYSPFGAEQMEIGLKYWLGGGEIKVNKNTWYAHLFKNSRYYNEVAGHESRRFKDSIKATGGWKYATKHWINNEEPNMKHSFLWLIEKFSPVPSWPDDRSLWRLPE